MVFSERSQIVIVWWALVFAVIFGVAFAFLLHMVPPPDAHKSAEWVRAWYQHRSTDIKIGATISSYSSAFLVPLFAVIGMQIARCENGKPIWAVMTVTGGSLAAIFLVLPPMFFGVAAFTPGRDADATAVMHQLGVLTLVTTTQFFLFAWVAMIVVSLHPRFEKTSPFPRWYGYLNGWLAMMFELGALAYNFDTGPFSWNGLFVFYSPFTLFSVWIGLTSYFLLTSLKCQVREAAATP